MNNVYHEKNYEFARNDNGEWVLILDNVQESEPGLCPVLHIKGDVGLLERCGGKNVQISDIDKECLSFMHKDKISRLLVVELKNNNPEKVYTADITIRIK